MRNDFQLGETAPADVDAWATALFDQIFDDPHISEPDMEAALARGEVTISFLVVGHSFDDAAQQGINVVQSALKMLPDGDDWPRPHIMGRHAELVGA
jgi:hypothetical protein